MDFFEWFAERTSDCANKRFLNDDQKDAIKVTRGAVLVAAGAGTGKTTMITAKAAYLIKQENIKPDRLIMLTFSHDAANHMKEEIVKILPEARDVYANTFHSFCFDFLKTHSQRTGITDDFKVLAEANAEFLMYKELDVPAIKVSNYINTIQRAKDLDVSQKDYEGYISQFQSQLKVYIPDASNVVEEISKAKLRLNTLYLGKQDKASREEKKNLTAFIDTYEELEKYDSFLKAWKGYEQLKSEKKMLDYADMIKMVIDYCQVWGDDELADQYDYVIVDEFQDTNRQQFKLLKILASKCGNITAVGDENQAIYAFRGAYPENIYEFKKEFKATIKDLTENYRSTNTILRTAHRLILNNYESPDDTCLLKSTVENEGDRVKLITTVNPNEQARRVAEEIERLAKNGVEYSHIAILFRSHSSAQKLQSALESHNIPFQLISNNGFLRRPEVRTALAYLYAIANLEDPRYGADQMWWRLLHNKYGLTMRDSHILGKAAKHDSIQNVLIGKLPDELSEDAKIKINSLLTKIEELRQNKNKSLSNLLLDVYETSGLSREFSYESTRNTRTSMLNLRYLHELVTDFEDFYGTELTGFIEYMRMLDQLGEELDAPVLNEAQGVVLRTCHGAKGLEYDHVFIVDLVGKKFPIMSGGQAPLLPDELNDRYKDIYEAEWASEKEQKEALEARKRELRLKEERRLAYVAYTRAKKELYLCYARDYGEKERDPSMFIAESCYDQGAVHNDIEFIQDNELKVGEMSKDTPIEKKKKEIKKLMLSNMDSEPDIALYNLLLYEDLSGHKMSVNSPLATRAADDAAGIIKDISDGRPAGLKFDPSEVILSHSSLKTYRECPKKFELARLLRMPSRYDDEEGDGALGFGTFVHEVLELTAKNKVKSRQEIDDIASRLLKEPGYKAININRAKVIFDIFWERNKNKLDYTIMMEQPFSFEIEGYHFTGKIDRVDKLNGNGEVDIVDYKTGREPSKEDRESQLLLYKLAFEHDPALKVLGLKTTNLTLELLEEEKPRIFQIDGDGYMVCINGRCTKANVAEVEKSLLDIAACIKHDYENGFETKEDCGGTTGIPGSSCEYRMYCPRWG